MKLYTNPLLYSLFTYRRTHVEAKNRLITRHSTAGSGPSSVKNCDFERVRPFQTAAFYIHVIFGTKTQFFEYVFYFQIIN